ncbi:MAG: hypothetical protein ABI682_14740 [Acidobacteriota bacterium]
MKNPRGWPLVVAAGGFALALLGIASQRVDARAPSPGSAATPMFGDAFWKRWGDGKGELAGYDLVFPRYGQQRKGVAVTIFVTETFSNSLRVKSDPGKHPASDEFPVMKLNLVEDFQTGIYDYNLLTSAFVALVPVNGRPAGSATKVSFSSQEWCGGVYGQMLFDAGSARLTSHSYFDGEADQTRSVAAPLDALSGDAILLWARGLAAPQIQPGERKEVPLVKSIETARLSHSPVDARRVVLSRDAVSTRVTVPAGNFEVERRVAAIVGGATWKIDVEAAEPHRIIAWETSEGEKATLLASERLEYWKLHGEGQESFLAKIGLKPRPPRTP